MIDQPILELLFVVPGQSDLATGRSVTHNTNRMTVATKTERRARNKMETSSRTRARQQDANIKTEDTIARC